MVHLISGYRTVPLVLTLLLCSLLCFPSWSGQAYAQSATKKSTKPKTAVAKRGVKPTSKKVVTKKATPKPTSRPTGTTPKRAVLASRSTKSTNPARTIPKPSPKPSTKLSPNSSAKNVSKPTAPITVASLKPILPKSATGKTVSKKPTPNAIPPIPDNLHAAAIEIIEAGKARINYDANVVKAVGMGAIPAPSLKKTRGQDILEAREVAVADALRNLSMAVSQVRVTSDTRVENYVLKSDEIRVRIEAMIRGARILEEKLLPTSGVYRVIVQLRLKGPNSLLDAIEAAEAEARRAAVAAAYNPFAPGMPAPDSAEYTSLIVDCRGLRVAACPAPKLYDNERAEVYGTMKISPDFVNEVGIVSYPRSMQEARTSPRAGKNPLVIRARGVADNNRFHPIISTHDAEKIRDANHDSKFMERVAVIFLVDPL